MTKWREIWEKRQLEEHVLQDTDVAKLFIALKRANGFDVVGEGIPYESLIEQYNITKAKLLEHAPATKSLYEVGCGSGANLLLFERDGWNVGGVDYSASLIDIATKVLKSDDLLYAPASEMPDAPMYDAILSNSVFSYFADELYAQAVLEKMCRKVKCAIVLLDIHDIAKKDAFISYRKATIKDYEELYRDLPKLFYDKAFFERFAKENELSIEFINYNMEGYWNNQFVFHLIMWRK
ncbi:MAG: class I SAM-dependent methyltransferase [bacterium]|nr:class I SAM-dependent methyltransferase [bacterium]